MRSTSWSLIVLESLWWLWLSWSLNGVLVRSLYLWTATWRQNKNYPITFQSSKSNRVSSGQGCFFTKCEHKQWFHLPYHVCPVKDPRVKSWNSDKQKHTSLMKFLRMESNPQWKIPKLWFFGMICLRGTEHAPWAAIRLKCWQNADI